MEIPDIKRLLPLPSVLAHYGIRPDKNGMINCPFHEDKTPSMKVYPCAGTFHCFGCGATGDQIEFIQKKEGLDKHAAIMKAKSLTQATPATKRTHPQKTKAPWMKTPPKCTKASGSR